MNNTIIYTQTKGLYKFLYTRQNGALFLSRIPVIHNRKKLNKIIIRCINGKVRFTLTCANEY